jgi:ribosomal protein S18 acetylase RimI-like enzyme
MNYKKIKNFGGKKIVIRPLLESDIKSAKKFQNFINSLSKEDAEINRTEKQTLKQEIEWLKARRKEVKTRKSFFLLAEHNNVVTGSVEVSTKGGRRNHVAGLGIMIRNGYRGIGLGSFMIKEAIKIAPKELKFSPKIIILSVTATNKPAFNLYIENNFKKVAAIPKQFKVKGKLVDEYIMLKYL